MRDVPALALSGFGMDEDIERSRDAGFSDHLTKPVSADALEEQIDKLKAFIGSSKKKLLIVEDNDVQRASIQELMTQDGIEFLTAATGEEALVDLGFAGRPFSLRLASPGAAAAFAVVDAHGALSLDPARTAAPEPGDRVLAVHLDPAEA